MPDNTVRKYHHKIGKKDIFIQEVDTNDGNNYGNIENSVWYPNSRFLEETHTIVLEKYGGYVGFERGVGVYESILEQAKQVDGNYKKASVFIHRNR